MQELLIVLGKRLSDDLLTDEAHSRIDALVDYLETNVNPNLVVAFSGGVTGANHRAEADVMYDAFKLKVAGRQADTDKPLIYGSILLETQSRSTVENVQNVAEKVVSEGGFSIQSPVKVTFLSNDYHLQRLFEIQSWMDEQGLLRLLKHRASQAGITLDIAYDITQHVAVPYPHVCFAGKLFLLVDNLTPYRVLLEGIVAGSF